MLLLVKVLLLFFVIWMGVLKLEILVELLNIRCLKRWVNLVFFGDLFFVFILYSMFIVIMGVLLFL